MNKKRFIWALMLIGLFLSLKAGGSQLYEPWRFSLAPELAQSLPLIGVDVAHQLGATGKGVSVIVIDNFTRNRNDPCNDLVHGDWVSGVLEAVAPEANIYRIDVPLDVPGTKNRPCYGFSAGALIEALRQALAVQRELNIRVINYSIGGGHFQRPCDEADPMADLIRQLVRQGVLFVTAAGNNGFTDALGFPECMPETISVGSVYDYTANELEQASVCAGFPRVDQVTCYSNSAFFLDVLAPGSWITVSSTLNSIGTSASAPHVAGVIALLLQVDPTLNLSDVRSILRRTGKPVTDQRNGLTFPRVDAQSAVSSLLDEVAQSSTEALAEALDVDKNRVLGDEEILEAVRLWITAQRVDDVVIFQLIELWVSGSAF